MLIQFLEFTYSQATIIAIALPIVTLCLFILVTPWIKNGSSSKWWRYLSYFIKPPRISDNGSEVPESDAEGKPPSLWREDKVRLFFFYLGVVLFLVSFMIGEFYEVMIDLMLPISQGSTGVYRTATNVIFQTPFNAGWTGVLPWVGYVTYHETWNWVLFTAALSDNPDFFGNIIIMLLLISAGVGLTFLSPLAIKSIRHSFLPSMFFFTTGMTIFTKAAVSYLAEVLALVLLDVQLQYLHVNVTADMIPDLLVLLASGVLLMSGMFALFVVLGRKLWRVYYSDSRSQMGFIIYIALILALGLTLTMMMV